MDGATVLNYISSHDDGSPFDLKRERTYESATKLLLTQGGAQIYYGDELGRSLSVKADGDAKLRSFMNWEDMEKDSAQSLLIHWRKLGQFRHDHPSIAAGRHQQINEEPYTFTRTLEGEIADKVIVTLDLEVGKEYNIDVSQLGDLKKVNDGYSGQDYEVENGKISIIATHPILLLSK